MVQNSTATKSPLVEISKVERQASGQPRYSQDPQNLNALLQDILCFFILLSLGLLVVASIFCVALNVHHAATQQHSHRVKSANVSRLKPADGLTKQERLCVQRGPIWIRFLRCRQQQQDSKQEPVREMEQVRNPKKDMRQRRRQPVKLEEQKKQQSHFIPSYQPIDYSELAAGDSAKEEATVKESDSRTPPLPVDNF